jgi:hypothetical protein
MTEAEWLWSVIPEGMLSVLESNARRRKVRLFAVACCRHGSHLFDNSFLGRAVEVAEQLADGLATHAQLREAYKAMDSSPLTNPAAMASGRASLHFRQSLSSGEHQPHLAGPYCPAVGHSRL